jgi:hypothetical protein
MIIKTFLGRVLSTRIIECIYGGMVMMNSRTIRFLYMIMALGYGQAALGLTVNVDMEGGHPTDATYAGDDGILSTTGGTVWNSVYDSVDTTGLLDEFGNATGLGISWHDTDVRTGSTSANNSLQDSGTVSSYNIIGLDPTLTYNFALYGHTYLAVTHDTDVHLDASFGLSPTYTLPGDAGQDYILFTGLVPYDLGGGVYGISIMGGDGATLGFQIHAVPLPAAFWLFGSGLLGMLGLYRRRKTA